MSLDATSVAKLETLVDRTAAALAMLTARGAAEEHKATVRTTLVDLHVKLGEHWLRATDIPRARDHVRAARSILPDHRGSRLLEVRILLAERETERAVSALDEIAALFPDDTGVLQFIGNMLINIGRPAEAVEPLRRARILRPEDAALQAMLADALGASGKQHEALDTWRAVLRQAPDHVPHLERYAALCSDAGDIDAAGAAYRRLTELRPERGANHRMLGLLTRCRKDDTRIGRMQELLAHADSESDNAREFHFALYRAFDDIGDYRTAFAHLKAANDILRSRSSYRPDLSERVFASVEAAFGAIDPSMLAAVGRPERPVFIVGMPRSGSTLTEQILSRHPSGRPVGETPAFAGLVERHFLKPSLEFDLAPLGDRHAVSAIGKAYLEAVGITDGGHLRSVDKYLTNFLSIGVIKAVFPHARFVNTTRMPLANCFAIYSSYFETAGLGFKADMAETARYYVRYDRLMDFWRKRFGDDILDFSYETLTENQEVQTRRLLDHCGLAWTPDCLDFHLSERLVKTASFAQVRQKLYSGVDRKTGHYLDQLSPMTAVLASAGLYRQEDAA